MKSENCIFCKIVEGIIPSRTIYEDDTFRVILDIMPATRGHAMILTKDHVENLYDLPDEIAAKALVLAKKMALLMTDRLGCDGFNIIQNNGAAAGQVEFHFHLHLIPRYKNDGHKFKLKSESPTSEELDEVMQQILGVKS